MHVNIELLSNEGRFPSVKYNGGSALSADAKSNAIVMYRLLSLTLAVSPLATASALKAPLVSSKNWTWPGSGSSIGMAVWNPRVSMDRLN